MKIVFSETFHPEMSFPGYVLPRFVRIDFARKMRSAGNAGFSRNDTILLEDPLTSQTYFATHSTKQTQNAHENVGLEKLV